MAMISMKDYAIKHGKNPSSARYMAARGSFRTAQKIGRDWYIDEDEPYLNHWHKEQRDIEWENPNGAVISDGLISIKQYAINHGKHPSSVRYMVSRGCFQTAQRAGREWLIDKDEPYPDNRVKDGKYIGWRKPKDRNADTKKSP